MQKLIDHMQKNIDPYLEKGGDMPWQIFLQILFVLSWRGILTTLKAIGVMLLLILFALSGGR